MHIDKFLCIDYQIDFKDFKFKSTRNLKNSHWNMSMYDWTPLVDEVDPILEKWSLDMYDMTLELMNDDRYINTKNYKSSIMKYENGYINEHTDRGMLSFIYNISDNLEIYIDNEWSPVEKDKLLIFYGDLGPHPLKHRRLNANGLSLNFFASPDDIEYPWLL